MPKLCLIYNFAQHYRTSIFKLISENYDCDFYFGENRTDIKGIDFNQLRGNSTVMKTTEWHKISYYHGAPSLVFKNYDACLMLGEERCISTWLLLILAKFFPDKKVYLWSHGKYGKEGKLKTLVQRIFFGLADGSFLYGNYAKKIMIEAGFNANKLYVIHNSLNYDRQLQIRNLLSPSNIYKDHFKNEFPTLIFIGRLTPVKHLDMLLQAVSNLGTGALKYNVVFIGDGVEKQLLKALSERLNIKDNVWFYGACYDEMTNAELIYNADLCVAPGNVGLTAMHTMVFGTPVISHNNFAWQMPEFEAIVPGKTGDFFEYMNQKSLENSIAVWFENNKGSREAVRVNCYDEIDSQWNPHFQLNVLKSVIK